MSGLYSSLLLLCALGWGAHVRREGPVQCKPLCEPHCLQSSRTGRPCLPVAASWPYKTQRTWSADLGERILRSATPSPRANEDACGGFKLFGDSAWCLAAFADAPQKGLEGLSFGIEERDLWSETMSNVFHMPTKLYDCFQDPKKSPPLSMTAPNAAGPCRGKQSHCYETPYQAFRTCLGPESGVLEGRNYTSLAELLQGRAPLSTHVKMDVEGSEWSVLEALLAADLAKIRSLDMEVHFGFAAASEAQRRQKNPEEALRREVDIFEKLASRFLVVGSNVETNAQGWDPASSCSTALCEEPLVHTRGGFPVNQFAVSFVNPALLRTGRPNAPLALEVAAHGMEGAI